MGLAGHHFHSQRLQFAAVEHARVAELTGSASCGFPGAEIVLAADVEREVSRKLVAVLLQEPDQRAVVVEVAVTEDQALHLGGVNTDDFHVVE